MDGGNARNLSGAFPCGQIYRKWISAVQQEYGRYLERFDLVMKIQLDMYQTLAAAVLVLMLGAYLKSKIHFLEQFCIPAPVVGGLLFAIFTCICYVTGVAEFSFDDTLREVCMVFFFTSVGFQANLKVLKSGGISGTCDPADRVTEPGRSWNVKASRFKPAHRYVYRFDPDGRRTWYRRSFRTCSRGL